MPTANPYSEGETQDPACMDELMREPLLEADEGRRNSEKTSDSSSLSDFRLFPSSIKFLVWNEFCERFSFYGMKTILALFLFERLRLTETQSTELVHLFIVACYFTPVMGAILSDGFLGKYGTILYLSILYSFGNWAMSLSALFDPIRASEFALWSTVLALGLIALGTGGIKPCVTAFGGDQIEWSLPDGEAKDRLRMKFFSLYYFAINAGSFISTVLTPILRADLSYAVAFAVPALLMMGALLVFWLGRRTYIDRPPEGNVFPLVGRIIVDAIRLRNTGSRNELDMACLEAQKVSASKSRHWLDAAKLKYNANDVEDVKSLMRVLVVLLPAPLFWSLFDQQSSKWVFQAREMDGHVPWLGNLAIQPDQMQAMNPILILLLIPLFDQVIYPLLNKRGFSLRPIQRMLMGMFLSTLAFLISGLLQLAIDSKPVVDGLGVPLRPTIFGIGSVIRLFDGNGKQVSILWQIPQYVVVTSGEILFSITGLEFAYSQAPHSMKSVVQSVWLLTVAAGNVVTVLIVAIIGDKLSKANEFFFFSGGCAVAMLLMMWIGYNFKYRSQLTKLQVEEDAEIEVGTTIP